MQLPHLETHHEPVARARGSQRAAGGQYLGIQYDYKCWHALLYLKCASYPLRLPCTLVGLHQATLECRATCKQTNKHEDTIVIIRVHVNYRVTI